MINANLLEIKDPVQYYKALELQKCLQQQIITKEFESTLILLEHKNVYTVGKAGGNENILLDEEKSKQLGVEVYQTNRGGNVTYHGPGQLVGYLLFDLNHFDKDIHKFIYNVEEAIIFTLQKYNIIGKRDKDYPNGVWVNDNKIAAIGMGVSKWVTIHGFALNINTNLEYFNYINPCGIINRGVTSMERELKHPLDFSMVKEEIKDNIGAIFNLSYDQLQLKDLRNL